jgi:hypothetical protein
LSRGPAVGAGAQGGGVGSTDWSLFEPGSTGTLADVAARARSVSRGRDPSTVDCEESCTRLAGGAVLGDVLVVGPDIWTIASSRPIGLASAGESVQPAGV